MDIDYKTKTFFEKAVLALLNNSNCFRLDASMSAEDRQRQRTDIMREACVIAKQVHDYGIDSRVLDYLDSSRVAERELWRDIRTGTGRPRAHK